MQFTDDERTPIVTPQSEGRRRMLQLAGGAVAFGVLGGWYVLQKGEAPTDAEARRALAVPRADGNPRLPPGQYLLKKMRDMGGQRGEPEFSKFRLRVYGEVKKPFELDYAELLKLPQTEQTNDVHCVTRWSLLDGHWKGVRVQDLADKAGLKDSARHVIFEAAHGYTSNVLLEEALKENTLVAHHFEGDPLAHEHGGPVRALVPDLYFWKSAKWLTGIRFVEQDEPGFWENRGYNNHADPWREERYAA